MKTIVISSALSLMVGLSAGWLGGVYRHSKSTQENLHLFKIIELDSAEKRAKEAYARQPPIVGIWELRHVIGLLEEARSGQLEGPKTLQLRLFLAHARLARLNHLEGEHGKAQEHYLEAVRFYNEDHPNAKITDFNEMFERLQKFDKIAKVERSP
jgi:hypothetical protein